MINRVARLWRALRDRIADRIAKWRATLEQRRADAAPQHAETIRVLQQWLDCSRDDVRREQTELIREREEIARLHAEVDQLRSDNRALLNSLLGTAGIPPLPLSGEGPRTGAEASPLRRPSWRQIAAKREISAAREAEAARKQQQEKH